MASQLAIMAAPALAVVLAEAWSLDAAEMGWLGGAYFAGYAATLPFLTGAANRTDPRRVYAASALLAAAASFAAALFADGFWTAVGLRFLAGGGFAGIHLIGMKLLADRLSGPTQARAAALYTAAFAIGTGLSYLVAGAVQGAFGWRAVFLVAGCGALAAAASLFAVRPLPGAAVAPPSRFFPDFVGVFRNVAARRYVFAYAGNLWEVFSIRVWVVPFLVMNGALGDPAGWPEPAVLAGLSAILAVPVNLAVAELGVRFNRRAAIAVTSAASVLVCLVLGWQAAGPYALAVALILLHGFTSFGDVGAIAGGLVGATSAAERGAALALAGMIGFAAGFVGPYAVGAALDLAGDRSEPGAWIWAFAVMALGSVASGLAMWGRRGRP